MLKIKVTELNNLLSAIAKVTDLYAPISEGKDVNFKQWTEGKEINLFAQSVKSPKDMFFPQTMDLYSLKMQDKSIEIKDDCRETKPFVVFGVRACDCASIGVLDKLFLSNPVDTYYQSRRENGTIVGLACSKPAETCFCSTFGIDCTEPQADVVTYLVDSDMYWQPITDKGIALTEKVKSLFVEVTDTTKVDDQKAKTKAIVSKLPLKDLDLSKFKGENLNELFNSPNWAELSESCLGCGACTFVCPTCHCYDIRDFKTNDGIKRFRCWDSCMYSDFTKMSAGQPRTTQLQRFRQRFMHKLVYFPTNFDGTYACVGCGRCIQKCPISMNIAKVIKKFGESNNKFGGSDND